MSCLMINILGHAVTKDTVTVLQTALIVRSGHVHTFSW